jgi:hypothetical protein
MVKLTPEAKAFNDGYVTSRKLARCDVKHACLMAVMMLEVVVMQHGTDRLLKRIDAELLDRLDVWSSPLFLAARDRIEADAAHRKAIRL